MDVSKRIKVNCHSSICIDDCIYIDPYNIKEESHNAKAVFITHSHYDHCDIESIKRVIHKDTTILAPYDCIDLMHEAGLQNTMVALVPNMNGEVEGVQYSTILSYNIDKQFHPKQNNWLGYILNIDDTTFTICGDSDVTEELKAIKTDVLFVPIGGVYTMDYIEASKLTNKIDPKVVVPVHYGDVVGDKELAQRFAGLVDDRLQVLILI